MHIEPKGATNSRQSNRQRWPAWMKFDDVINAAMLAAMAAALSIQVFSRYVLNYSIGWSSEIAGILLAWLMFLGAPAMLRRHSHMSIYLFGFLAPLLQRIIRIVIELACGVFYAVLLFGSFDLMRASAMYETSSLGLPGEYIAAVVPVASVYLIVRTLLRIADLLRSEHPAWLEQEEEV